MNPPIKPAVDPARALARLTTYADAFTVDGLAWSALEKVYAPRAEDDTSPTDLLSADLAAVIAMLPNVGPPAKAEPTNTDSATSEAIGRFERAVAEWATALGYDDRRATLVALDKARDALKARIAISGASR